MYIGFIAVVMIFAVVALFFALCAIIWAAVNIIRWFGSLLYENRLFVPFTFDEAIKIFSSKSASSSYGASRSTYNFPSTTDRQSPNWPTPDSMNPKSAEHFQKMVPYLLMTDQMDDFAEGGWWNVDLDRDPWEDHDD